MKKDLWAYKDYKKYIKDKIESSKGLTKSNLAKACSCQSAYISQVLNGHANFSLEQIYDASEYLGHTNEEHDFFILMHQENKAGTVKLRKYYKSKMNELLQARLNLSKRIESKTSLSLDEQARYFSSWIYTAIHLATTIPELSNVDEISNSLGLNKSKVSEVTNFLMSCGLLDIKNNTFVPGKARMHLSSDSHLLPMMHTNARQYVVEKLQHQKQEEYADNLIYSSMITLSSDDFNTIKEILINAIQEAKDIVRPSKEEVMGLFNIDFIKLT